MANLYVGSDGVIHSGNGKGVSGAVAVNTNNVRTTRNHNVNSNSSYNSYYSNASYVSKGRKIVFWIFSVFVGIAIGIGIYNLIGSSIFATYEAESAPQVVSAQ